MDSDAQTAVGILSLGEERLARLPIPDPVLTHGFCQSDIRYVIEFFSLDLCPPLHMVTFITIVMDWKIP